MGSEADAMGGWGEKPHLNAGMPKPFHLVDCLCLSLTVSESPLPVTQTRGADRQLPKAPSPGKWFGRWNYPSSGRSRRTRTSYTRESPRPSQDGGRRNATVFQASRPQQHVLHQTPAEPNRLEADPLTMLSKFQRREACQSKIAKVFEHPLQHGGLAAAGGTGQEEVLEPGE